MSSFLRAYKFVALQLLNTVVLFIGLNLVLGALLAVLASGSTPPVADVQNLQVDVDAYHTVSREDVLRYHSEQAEMDQAGFQYERWVLFRNPEHKGRLLNTNHLGFRRTRAPRRSCADPVRVFVFGGSTTFGYGVPDDQTLPSRLQENLERLHPSSCIEVSNYGQGYYFSSQELLLFMGLLKQGRIPAWAIFVDGANDTWQLSARRDEPYFSQAVRSLWDLRQRGELAEPCRYLQWLPVVRLAQWLRPRARSVPAPTNDPAPVPDSQRSGAYVAERYLHNMRLARAVCREYGVNCRFVWQPTFFNYDRALHPAAPYKGEAPKFWMEAYGVLREVKADDFLYLGDLFVGVKEKVFVDNVHYSDKWNGEIAARIAPLVRLRAGAGP